MCIGLGRVIVRPGFMVMAFVVMRFGLVVVALVIMALMVMALMVVRCVVVRLDIGPVCMVVRRAAVALACRPRRAAQHDQKQFCSHIVRFYHIMRTNAVKISQKRCNRVANNPAAKCGHAGRVHTNTKESR